MRKTRKKISYKATSLLELIVVIAVISILASIVSIGLFGSRQDARDNSVLQSMSSVAPLAYKCLAKNINPTGSPPGTRINNAQSAAYLCIQRDNSNNVTEFSNWPNISRTGWNYAGFFWCVPGYAGTSPTSCGNYNGSDCGGNWSSKKFCYGIHDPNSSSCQDSDARCIWCTENGCQQKGF